MKEKLFDSEAKVMEIIWNRGPLSAKEISLIAADSIGWNKNTTYTVIKKLESKGFTGRNAEERSRVIVEQGFWRVTQGTVFSIARR